MVADPIAPPGRQDLPWQERQAGIPRSAARQPHDTITGATGTGKTVTLQVLAEGFSAAGVPVFAADIKGDLSGIAAAGEPKDFLVKRAAEVGLDGEYRDAASPAVFWDVFGEHGHPIRATVLDLGPLLLSRMLEAQRGAGGRAQHRLPRRRRRENADRRPQGPALARQRHRPALEGADAKIRQRRHDLGRRHPAAAACARGAGRQPVLRRAGPRHPRFPAHGPGRARRGEHPHRGQADGKAAPVRDIPAVDAHCSGRRCPRSATSRSGSCSSSTRRTCCSTTPPSRCSTRIEQIARLVRSQGVGVYSITQNPRDVPDTVSAQLGNRVQHALRAFTQEQKAVRAAAETFHQNPVLDTERVILELKVGEALVSMLENKGEPSIVQRTLIRPPAGRLGPVTEERRRAVGQARCTASTRTPSTARARTSARQAHRGCGAGPPPAAAGPT